MKSNHDQNDTSFVKKASYHATVAGLAILAFIALGLAAKALSVLAK